MARSSYGRWHFARRYFAQGEGNRVEGVLAITRVFLVVCSLVAVYVDPTEPPRYASLACRLLTVYAASSLLILLLVRARSKTSPIFGFVVQAMDVLWAVVLTVLTEGPTSPFFLFFLFLLVETAYRWGFVETVAIACLTALLLVAEWALMISSPWKLGPIVEREFELNRFIMRATYLVFMGLLLGYLAEGEKRLRAKSVLLGRILAKAQAKPGLQGTLGAILQEIPSYFGAEQALIAAQYSREGKFVLWTAQRAAGSQPFAIQDAEISPAQAETYFFASVTECWHAIRRPNGSLRLLALDREGRRARSSSWSFPASFLAEHSFCSLFVATFFAGEEFTGRLFLFDSRASVMNRTAELRSLQRLARELEPAVLNSYMLPRLRSQVGAAERARVAQELHDGAIQSLLAAEMQLEVLQGQATKGSVKLASKLSGVQKLIHQEVLNLRELMEQIKPVELSPEELLGFMGALVEKFHRETGISTTFTASVKQISLQPHACTQLARIVQEALINVRRHSGAGHVELLLGSSNGRLKLVIEDDGRGFGFSGRYSHAELDATRQGPVVIKERVRSLGGEVTVESNPGRGSRLEISLPQTSNER